MNMLQMVKRQYATLQFEESETHFLDQVSKSSVIDTVPYLLQASPWEVRNKCWQSHRFSDMPSIHRVLQCHSIEERNHWHSLPSCSLVLKSVTAVLPSLAAHIDP